MTASNSDGFIPGEAGAAVLVGARVQGSAAGGLACLGIGFGHEKATVDSAEPLCADGLVESIRAALAASGLTMADIDYRVCDVNGEQHGFKEASLALARTLRVRKERFEMWHPADSIGAVGAAIVPCCIGVALTAAKKAYAPGRRILCHVGNDGGERAALILSYENGRDG